MIKCGIWFFLFTLLPLVANSQNCTVEQPMKEMLDAMEDMWEPGAKFNQTHYDFIRDCLEYFDPDLPASQDGGWAGMIYYWDSDGDGIDYWGSTPANLSECNATTTSMCDMIIFEPCDYTSNIAFYHTITEICLRDQDLDWPFFMNSSYVKAIVQAFAMVGVASPFWHGANTILGGQQDFISNDLFAYVQHQASLSTIPYNPVLHDLSFYERNMSSIELAQAFTDMYREASVYDWYNLTEKLDVPSIELAYSGLFSTIMTMVFEEEFVNQLIPLLADLLGVEDDELNFTMNYYLPQLREAIDGFQWTEADRVKFIGDSMGSVVKLVYALLWQEKILNISGEIFTRPIINKIGWELLPDLNVRASQFMTYLYYESKFQLGEDIYPGEDECNPTVAHAKWHLESALGILDLTYVCDDISRFLSTANNSNFR